MPADLVDNVTLFAGMFLGFISLGFIDARVSTRHPGEKERLGAPFLLGSRIFDSLRHESRWAGFILFHHFARRDLGLSALCLAHLVLWAAVVTLLLGLWSPSAFAA